MFGWMKSLFLDEKARKALDKRASAPARTPSQAARKAAPKGPPPMTAKRAALIKEAMSVHKAKRRILDDLSDEDRARLVAMAITALLNEGREPDTEKKKK